MSKKHLEEQKLLIENFNKWINEEEISKRPPEQTRKADDLNEAEEELDEMFGTSALAVGIFTKKLSDAMISMLRAYNDFTQITDEIEAAPESSDSAKAKAAAEEVTKAVKPPIMTQILKQAAAKFGLDLDIPDINFPTGKPKPEPEIAAEPEVEPTPEEPEEPPGRTHRDAAGLMSREKEDRLRHLKAKHRSPEDKPDDK